MSSQSSYEFYGPELVKMPPLRAIAETVILDSRVRTVTAAEAVLNSTRARGETAAD